MNLLARKRTDLATSPRRDTCPSASVLKKMLLWGTRYLKKFTTDGAISIYFLKSAMSCCKEHELHLHFNLHYKIHINFQILHHFSHTSITISHESARNWYRALIILLLNFNFHLLTPITLVNCPYRALPNHHAHHTHLIYNIPIKFTQNSRWTPRADCVDSPRSSFSIPITFPSHSMTKTMSVAVVAPTKHPKQSHFS